MSDQVKFLDGPFKNRKMVVEDYRKPIIAYKNLIISIDERYITPIAPFEQIEYRWVKRIETTYSDGSPPSIRYEMKVKK